MGALLFVLLSAALPASAQRFVPGPGEDGHDPALLEKAERHNRLQAYLLSSTLGWGLEAYVSDPADRAAIDAFIASGSRDFQGAAGIHPFEAVDYFEEHGDLGMFGGVQTAGDCFRYAVLRDSGAPADVVAAAREQVLRALDGLHWYHQVTGVPGVVARGIRRIAPLEPGGPMPPGEMPELVPLRDASGNPLPEDKHAVWRADNSGELPFLIWFDDTSKDQVDGWVLALGVYYDLLRDDPDIPDALIDRLVEDARAFGLSLMQERDIGAALPVIMVLMDADGRPTTFHDVSAEELGPGLVMRRPLNGFNAVMSLSIMRTLYHITGDDRIGRFYYEELVARRGYYASADLNLGLVWLGTMTNYSNVNMAFTAIYGLLRYESDPELAALARGLLNDHLYAPAPEVTNRRAQGQAQPYFDFMFAAFREGGGFGDGERAIREGMQSLREWPDAPYWNDRVVTNCDDAEIASRVCTGIDGTPITIAIDEGRGGGAVAEEPLPFRIRPPSNFHPRSDPHSVNGGGGTRLNPDSGFHIAYWMGRYFEIVFDGTDNISPIARPPLPRPPPPDAGPPDEDAAPPDMDAGTDAGETPAPGGGGCGCATTGPGATPLLTALALLALAVRRRRRQ